MCTSMTYLLQDQHEQWKRKPEKPSCRFSVASYLALIHSTQAILQSMMGLINHLEPELHSVVGVAHGKERSFVVVAGEHDIALRNIRSCINWRSGHKVDCRRISISSQSPSSTDSNSRNTLAEIDKAKALPWQHQIHQCPSQQGWQCTSLTLVCLLCNGSNIQWPEVVYAFGVLLLELLMGKCLSLTDNEGGGTIMDLPSWVQLVVREEWMAEVFDPQMVEMPQIAMVCTLVVSDQQLRMGQVAKMIEEVCGGGGELSP